jgi:rod shape-determining protein MreC
MAPSRHRRRGFSRRVQFSLFIGYVIAVVGAVFGLALVLVSRFDPQGFSILRGAALDVTAPVTSTGRTFVRGVGSIGYEVRAYFRAGSQNNRLREQLKIAQRRLIQASALEEENRRLKRVVRLLENHPAPIVVARLVGSDLAGHRRFATLSAGWRAGVRPGQPVRSTDGLVGRIFETGMFASRVVLLTDGGNNIPVRLVRSGTPILAVGRGDGALDLHALVGGGFPFKLGDVAVTSGTGGVYPPNIPVAVVVKVDGERAVAWPLADPARLDFAIVEPVYQPPLPSREAPPPRLP